MRAIINGVTIEGTAQEIAEYKRLIDDQDSAKKHVPITRDRGVVVPWDTYKFTDAKGFIRAVDNAVNPYTMT